MATLDCPDAPAAETPLVEAPPRARQLWLLDPPRTLHPRFDASFFRSIPGTPGVYLMHGRHGLEAEPRVLYVGKAINLRRRVRSYASVRPGRASRKTVRLLARVDSISWEPCADERSALVREIELIQSLCPPFNRALTWPQGYWFIGVQTRLDGIVVSLNHEPRTDGHWFGAFKSRSGYNALARCLTILPADSSSFRRPPSAWLLANPPPAFHIPSSSQEAAASVGRTLEVLQEFLAGRSDALLAGFRDRLSALPEVSAFDRHWIEEDIEGLDAFFTRGPRRNAALRFHRRLATPLIPKDQLDRWLLQHPTDVPESGLSSSEPCRDSRPATS